MHPYGFEREHVSGCGCCRMSKGSKIKGTRARTDKVNTRSARKRARRSAKTEIEKQISEGEL